MQSPRCFTVVRIRTDVRQLEATSVVVVENQSATPQLAQNFMRVTAVEIVDPIVSKMQNSRTKMTAVYWLVVAVHGEENFERDTTHSEEL